MHELISHEVQADKLAGTRLIGQPARMRAEALYAEIECRGLLCQPID